MQKILILGAGVYQTPLIKKAREMGLYTIVVSIPGNYPGFEYADKIYYINTTDTSAVLEVAKSEAINGIITTGTDVALSTLGAVCDELHLCGVSRTAAEKSCDKILMKQALESGNVNIAKYYVSHFSDPISLVKDKCCRIGYPLVVKAVDSSGSRGITIVKNEKMIENAIAAAKNVSRSNSYLIEEFLDGHEFGADALIVNGKIEFILPHGKYVYMANTGVPVGHYAPCEDDALVSKTIAEAKKAIAAMGYDNCCINFDLMLCNGKPYVIEVGARSGATCIPEIISLYNGYDYYEAMINLCLGKDIHESTLESRTISADNVTESKFRKASSAKLLFNSDSGKLKCIDGLDKIHICNPCESEGIYEIVVDKKPGDEINAFSIGPDRIGHIVAYADTVKRAEYLLENALSNIKIILE